MKVVVTHKNQRKTLPGVVYVSRRAITAGEELTVGYYHKEDLVSSSWDLDKLNNTLISI